MDTLLLFTERVSELESLSEMPRVLWYPSAGIDFRSPVFLTKYHIQQEQEIHGREFIKPELFLLNCLGSEVIGLKEKLENGEVELWSDQSTRIVGKNFISLQLRNDINFEINSDYIDVENLNLNDFDTERAFYFELEVTGQHYIEIQKVLYFEAENIDFFSKIILQSMFDTQYLCSTREGLSWGACKKSIVDYIYGENQPHFFFDRGFAPTFQILSNNYTKKIFEGAIQNSDLSVVSHYSNYISESDDFTDDSVIHKIKYST